MAQLAGKQIKTGSIDVDRLSFSVSIVGPTKANKNMYALVTSADFQLATSSSLAFTPFSGSYVEVQINGASQVVGDGDRTHDCYFSIDSGSTSLGFSSLISGSLLYWNGSISGFQLSTSDKIDFYYEV